MNPLVLFLGAVAVLGVVLILRSGKQAERQIEPQVRQVRLPVAQLSLAGGVSLVLFAMTQWWALILLGGGAGWALPGMRRAAKDRERTRQIDEALPKWLEVIRGSVVSGMPIHLAIEASVQQSDPVISAEVRDLARWVRIDGLRRGLIRFGAEMANPVVDVVVIALVLTEQHGGERQQVLDWIVRRLRSQAQARREIEAGRRRIYMQVKMVGAISTFIFLFLILFSGPYLEPYNSFLGQLVLLGVGAFFGGAAFWLSRLMRETPELRPFQGRIDLREAVS